MLEVFVLIGNNLGMSISNVILLVLNLGLLVFFARGFKEGSILMFLMNGLVTIAYYKVGWYWQYPIALMFISLLFMCFSLLFLSDKNQVVG